MEFNLPPFWRNSSSKRKRIYFVVFMLIVAFIATVIGSYVKLSPQDANTIAQNLNSTVNQNKASNTLTQYIFLNNFEICLLMFIPVVGAALGLFILFDTGVALGAIAATQGYPVALVLLGELLTPVFWLEFIAYSIAMAESIWLFRRLIQRRLGELKWTAVSIGICGAILAISALIEAWIISIGG